VRVTADRISSRCTIDEVIGSRPALISDGDDRRSHAV
jgi:hypothetical protein